ncbi:hypothetical protein [Virgibacillus proomii]|uniref:hypothetical protein n=1 Tax=Virgibacillus proomii TaxID=84407 RepID=UPI0009845C6A|nr:hypothetical protein [Virgibacillus proomii]
MEGGSVELDKADSKSINFQSECVHGLKVMNRLLNKLSINIMIQYGHSYEYVLFNVLARGG